jgi:hypothetical protein
MKDCIAHLLRIVKQCQRTRKGDNLPRIKATPEPPPRVIEAKFPIAQAMFDHQPAGKKLGVVRVHRKASFGPR